MPKYRDTCTDEPFKPEDLPVRVLSSNAGYYIGQLEPCGAPFSRLSYCYYRTEAEAKRALDFGFPTGRTENVDLEADLKVAGVIK